MHEKSNFKRHANKKWPPILFHSYVWFLLPTWDCPQTASRLVRPFSTAHPYVQHTDRHTDSETTLLKTFVAIGRILCTACRLCGLRMGHVTLTTPLSGVVCQLYKLLLWSTYLPNLKSISPVTGIWKEKQSVQNEVVWDSYGSLKVNGNRTIR